MTEDDVTDSDDARAGLRCFVGVDVATAPSDAMVSTTDGSKYGDASIESLAATVSSAGFLLVLFDLC